MTQDNSIFGKCLDEKTFKIITSVRSEKIHVNGCMTVVWLALYKHVMPTLMICALVRQKLQQNKGSTSHLPIYPSMYEALLFSIYIVSYHDI
jgi:hypothetical protein